MTFLQWSHLFLQQKRQYMLDERLRLIEGQGVARIRHLHQLGVGNARHELFGAALGRGFVSIAHENQRRRSDVGQLFEQVQVTTKVVTQKPLRTLRHKGTKGNLYIFSSCS